MTKAELIKKYGIEWYEDQLAKNKETHRNRYHNDIEFHEREIVRHRDRYYNDSEYREAYKAKNNARVQRSYCRPGEFELIENYELAKADNFKGWHIHHRDEIRTLPSGMVVYRSREKLIENGRYYNCHANELIFLTNSDHMRLHNNLNRRGKK